MAACSGGGGVAEIIVPEGMSICETVDDGYWRSERGATDLIYEAGLNDQYQRAFILEKKGPDIFGPNVEKTAYKCKTPGPGTWCRTYKMDGFTKGETVIAITDDTEKKYYRTSRPMDFVWNGEDLYCSPK